MNIDLVIEPLHPSFSCIITCVTIALSFAKMHLRHWVGLLESTKHLKGRKGKDEGFETLPLYRAAHLHKDRNTYILKSKKLDSASAPFVKCHHTKVEQFVCPFGLDSCAGDKVGSGGRAISKTLMEGTSKVLYISPR